MKYQWFIGILAIQILLAGAVFAQPATVINDPNAKPEPVKLSPAEEELIKREVLPKARAHWDENAACEEEYEAIGTARGAFTKPKADQKLIFYQYCQTGNGFGNNGLVLLENGRIVGNYVSEGGWAMDLKVLPDINQNGLDEFLLYYSGGMHQGESGTGVDLMEFALATIKGIGWFQSDSFGEKTGDFAYKVSVKTGKTPLFYR
jgi:hypothetical protein